MKSPKMIALGVVVATSVGCVVTLPKIAADGKYQVLYLNGMPVVEFEYASAEACAVDANKIQEYDPDSRRAIASGKMRIECSSISFEDSLKYKSVVQNVMTGQIYPTRTFSKDGCIFLAKQNKDPSMKYSCLED